LDAGGNSLMVEEMTVVHEGWDATYATDYTASAAQFNNNEIQGSENVNQ
jgi:hypothetical protein